MKEFRLRALEPESAECKRHYLVSSYFEGPLTVMRIKPTVLEELNEQGEWIEVVIQ